MDEHTFVEVYRAKNSPQAFVLRQALEEAGIRATVENDLLQGAVGELPTEWPTSPRIVVETKDATKALEFVTRWEQAEATAPASSDGEREVANCLACGANIPEEAWKCPACGWSYKACDPGDDNLRENE